MYDKLFTQKFMEDNDIFFENLKQISEPNKKQELFQNYIQSIENILAEKEGRNPAVVQAHLLIGDENTHFYDDQIVEVKSGQVARHIGTYQYQNC